MRSYLNNCQKIEQVLGEVYRKLAGVRTYSERLRGIFEQMARDEDDHARQLELAKGVPEEVFFEGYRFDPEQLDELLRRAHMFLNMTDHPPRSERLMVKTARDMEMEFINIHLQNAVKFRDAAVAELFRDLARDDEEHLKTLDSYFETRKKASRPSLH
jgi:rubrerythrin